jgi:DNA-binding CsgD family transcriptional regulator
MAIPENHLAQKYEDLVTTLEFIRNSHDYTNLNDLKSGLQSHLNRILNSKFHLVSLNHPLSSNRLNGFISSFSKSSLNNLKSQIAFCQLTGEYCQRTCSLKKIGLEVFQQKSFKSIERILREQPNNKPDNKPCWECIHSGIRWINRPEPVPGLGFMRLIPEESYWSSRDLDVLNLIWPNLLQAIRVLAFKKLAKNFQNICKLLQENPIPTALLTDEFIIFYSNKAFDEVVPPESRETLPQVISDLLHKQKTKSGGTINNNPTNTFEFPFFKLNNRFFLLRFNKLDDTNEEKPGQWILKMEPRGRSGIRINRQINLQSLTNREREICHQIKEGKNPKEIAYRLFISYQTVRNHLSSIHKKLGVCSRTELTAILHR